MAKEWGGKVPSACLSSLTSEAQYLTKLTINEMINSFKDQQKLFTKLPPTTLTTTALTITMTTFNTLVTLIT